MKAFVVKEFAHHSQIPLTHDFPEPRPKPSSDEVLVEVHSAGLNFFDVSDYISMLLILYTNPFRIINFVL